MVANDCHTICYMHMTKLSLFDISLDLYTTGIFRIGVITVQNITAISIPRRKGPYCDSNTNVHKCNAETV